MSDMGCGSPGVAPQKPNNLPELDEQMNHDTFLNPLSPLRSDGGLRSPVGKAIESIAPRFGANQVQDTKLMDLITSTSCKSTSCHAENRYERSLTKLLVVGATPSFTIAEAASRSSPVS